MIGKKIRDWGKYLTQRKSERNYIYPFDGSPYPSHFSDPYERYFRTPYCKLQFAMAAGVMLCPGGDELLSMGWGMGYFLSAFVTELFNDIEWREAPPALADAVIDKSGQITGSDPQARIDLAKTHSEAVKMSLIAAFTIVAFMVLATLDPTNRVQSVNLIPNISLRGAIFFLSQPIARAVWSAYAAWKLCKKKWTVDTRPPKCGPRGKKFAVPAGEKAATCIP